MVSAARGPSARGAMGGGLRGGGGGGERQGDDERRSSVRTRGPKQALQKREVERRLCCRFPYAPSVGGNGGISFCTKCFWNEVATSTIARCAWLAASFSWEGAPSSSCYLIQPALPSLPFSSLVLILPLLLLASSFCLHLITLVPALAPEHPCRHLPSPLPASSFSSRPLAHLLTSPPPSTSP